MNKFPAYKDVLHLHRTPTTYRTPLGPTLFQKGNVRFLNLISNCFSIFQSERKTSRERSALDPRLENSSFAELFWLLVTSESFCFTLDSRREVALRVIFLRSLTPLVVTIDCQKSEWEHVGWKTFPRLRFTYWKEHNTFPIIEIEMKHWRNQCVR